MTELLESADLAIGAPEEIMRRRVEKIERWLAENAPAVDQHQGHLDAGTTAETYWHYGYLVALRDALALIGKRGRPN